MQQTPRRVLAAALVLALAGGTAACGNGSAGTTKETTAVTNASQVILIDVRTAEEFAAGHVEGAVNFDLESGAFQDQLANLDKNATYDLYCRSGRRSAIAAGMMSQAGFTHVTDLGGFEEAATALNKKIVTD